MKVKLLIIDALVALSLATPAFASTHVVQSRNGQRVVTTCGNHRDHWHSSGVSWNIGVGLPFYGGYYGGYPYYGSCYGGYPYCAGYPYYGSNYPYYSSRTIYRGYMDRLSPACRRVSRAPAIMRAESMT